MIWRNQVQTVFLLTVSLLNKVEYEGTGRITQHELCRALTWSTIQACHIPKEEPSLPYKDNDESVLSFIAER